VTTTFKILLLCLTTTTVFLNDNKTSRKCQALMTSLFNKTEGFFCFSFNKRSPKDNLGKLKLLHTPLLKNETKINKNNYATMPFMSKQVSLPKIS